MVITPVKINFVVVRFYCLAYYRFSNEQLICFDSLQTLHSIPETELDYNQILIASYCLSQGVFKVRYIYNSYTSFLIFNKAETLYPLCRARNTNNIMKEFKCYVMLDMEN